jgi:hypothetical protein
MIIEWAKNQEVLHSRLGESQRRGETPNHKEFFYHGWTQMNTDGGKGEPDMPFLTELGILFESVSTKMTRLRCLEAEARQR